MKTSPPRLDDQICLSLYSATNALLRAYRPLLEPLGLTYPQYLVLMALWEQQPQSVTEICARTRLETSTVTPVLQRLERKGLVIRARSDEDERKRVITLTPAGAQLEDAAKGVPYELACQAALTPGQGQRLKSLTEALYANLTGAD